MDVYVALAMIVPEVLGVTDAEQLDTVALTTARVHGVPVNEPVAVPVLVNATVPEGEDAVPAAEVSLTNAVQFTDCATTTVVGEHVTIVEVVRRVTVTVLLVPEIPLCALSVGVYVPLAITVPVPVGVNEAEQLDVVALTPARVQGDPLNDPAAVPVFVNATVPPGALAIPVTVVSFTKAVQLVACETTKLEGEHVMLVEVVLAVTVTVLPVPELPVWTPSVGE